MFNLDSINSQLDDLLHRICVNLQISDSQFKLAEERYHSVAKWLKREGSSLRDFEPVIYSQGSLKIGTTVKPKKNKNQEYDVDLVCELKKMNWKNNNPLSLLDLVEENLRENPPYDAILERMNRCIRLNYANEFHMDILPAGPDFNKGGNCVKVPDRKSVDWKDSNPLGYAEWFDLKSESYKTRLVERYTASVEPLPNNNGIENKSPLQRTVQLMKRFRDLSYEGNEKKAPISIVITTLAGELYGGQVSVEESLSDILPMIVKKIQYETTQKRRLYVNNPSNEGEDLSEKWDDTELYSEFVNWIEFFDMRWVKLKENLDKGLPYVKQELAEMFGEKVTKIAINEQAEYIQSVREKGGLGVKKGTAAVTLSSVVSVPIKTNTFYGE